MQHRGRRSEFNAQRRFVKQLVVTTSKHDKGMAEKICVLDNEQISDALNARFKNVVVGANRFERGEVIIDSRGRGSLQLHPDYYDWLLAIDNG